MVLYIMMATFFVCDALIFHAQVIAERLCEEEIGGLKELFKMIDTDNSGMITFDELKEGLKRVGSELMESEIKDLMEAVRKIVSINDLIFS